MEENKDIKKRGRPTTYTPELVKEFCSRIARGNSMRKVCLADDMPDSTTIFEWLGKYEDFSLQYVKATEERTEAHNEMILDLGDQAIALAQKVDSKASNAVVNAVKLKADNLKWVMSKMKPKKYGDKLDFTSGGEVIKGNTIILKDFNGASADSQ